MDDNTRTKILGVALAGILGFMFLKPAIMNPINDAEKKVKNAQAEFDKADAKEFALLQAQERISRGRDVSLPPQVAVAQGVYQRWITNLAEQCKFNPSSLSVSPGNHEAPRNRSVTVDVIVEGEVKLEGLSRFLYLFEQADLMHRITSLEIDSTGATKDAIMEVTLTAQGMSVLGTPDHDDVFPLTKLPEAIAVDSKEITVADAKGFPKKTPFLAQVGREMVSVTAIEGNKLTIEREHLGTAAVAHPAEAYVQLFPVAFGRKDASYDDYAAFVNSSPFTKPVEPRKLNPRLAAITDKTIAPGESVEMTAKAEDVDADVGEITFALLDASEGMTIDAATGKYSWTPANDAEAKAYPATIVVTQKNNPDLKLEKKFSVTIKLPNDAPKITVPESAVVVLGREFSLGVSAEDDGPADGLKFSLDGEIPEGLTIDGSTLKWIPPKTFSPGEYSVTVKVSDGGDPEKSDSGNLAISVRDDTAILTRFTGSVTLDGEPMAFFRDLAANKNPQLRVGDHITAAEIDAEVTEVARRHVLLADAAGVWRLNLGQNLRQRELIEPAEKTEETLPVEKEKTAEKDMTSEARPVEAEATEQPTVTEPTTEKPAAETEPTPTEPTPTEPTPAEPTPTEPTPAAEAEPTEPIPAAASEAETPEQPVEQ